MRTVDVWKRLEKGRAVRYRCFQDLTNGRFCVQSADFFQEPVCNEWIMQLEKQSIELLIEDDPFTRAGSFASLEEAIAAHERDFASE
jgi:hypothetical protein